MPVIYLDNAATTFPKPVTVACAVSDTLLYAGGNPGRAGHRLSLAAGHTVDKARRALAALLQVDDESLISFGLNGTDMLNAAIWGVCEKGFEVATTIWEHNSVLRPLNALKARGVISLRTAATVEKAMTRHTKLVVVSHASNVTGLVQPIESIAALCQMRGAMLLVDAAQTAGVLPVYPTRWGIDMVAMPGHKGLYGPQGTGALYVREGLDLRPFKQGGTGTSSGSVVQPLERPERYESGTMNTPGLAGLAAGIEYVLPRRAAIYAHEMLLTRRLLTGLGRIKGVNIYGGDKAVERVGTVAFNIGGLSSGEVADALNESGICVRGGLHCAPLAHVALGTPKRGAVRASVGAFNTMMDVEALLQAVAQLARQEGRR